MKIKIIKAKSETHNQFVYDSIYDSYNAILKIVPHVPITVVSRMKIKLLEQKPKPTIT